MLMFLLFFVTLYAFIGICTVVFVRNIGLFIPFHSHCPGTHYSNCVKLPVLIAPCSYTGRGKQLLIVPTAMFLGWPVVVIYETFMYLLYFLVNIFSIEI